MNLSIIAPSNFEKLSEELQSYIDNNKTGSILCLVQQKGKLSYCNKFGWKDKKNQIPIDFDSIYRIYSMTKPIVCLALLTLLEEGKFQLDEPISKYFPEFQDMNKIKSYNKDTGEVELEAAKQQITIKHLFTHTSGLSYGFNPMIPIDKVYGKKFGYTNEKNRPKEVLEKVPQIGSSKDLMSLLTELPLAFEPGSHWWYAFGIDILGFLVEKLSGQPLDKFLKERIFDKLGMTDTDFYIPENKWLRTANVYTLDDNNNLVELEGPIINGYKQKPKILFGGSGLVSTLEDYLKFTEMMLNDGIYNDKQIVSKETIDLMTQNHFPENKEILEMNFINPEDTELLEREKGFGFGLGVKVKIAENMTQSAVGEHFWVGALNTIYWIDPKNELLAILLTQYCPPNNDWIPPFDAFRIRQLVYNALKM